tara:strand:+ start:3169 stop:3321 length:153 start_codon:yes stop_codon:yes gene_type:complete
MKQTDTILIMWKVSFNSIQYQSFQIDSIAFSQIGIAPGDALTDFKKRNLS